MIPDAVQNLEALKPFLKDADHIDVKTFKSEKDMRTFLAGMFSYYPGWIRMLFRVRAGLVRILGMKQEGIPQGQSVRPEDISFRVGDQATFFTVEAAEEGHFYIAGTHESHLSAWLAVVSDTGSPEVFHLATIVKYNNWTGPVYFNVIRPFHHLVVQAMGNAGMRYQPS